MKIAVTGNIASGKSRVAEFLRDKGCILIDADKIAHELYAGSLELVKSIVKVFGDSILDPDGTLDRKALGRRVFGDQAALEALNRIVHPALLAELRARIAAASKQGSVVVDAALIYEWGIQDDFDAVICVTAPEALRLERLMARGGLSREEAEARIRSQMPESEKAKKAAHVIENTGAEEELGTKVDAVWEKLRTPGI